MLLKIKKKKKLTKGIIQGGGGEPCAVSAPRAVCACRDMCGMLFD